MHFSDAEMTDAVASSNVRSVAEQIVERSPILRDMLEAGEIGIVGGMYNVDTGRVDFFDDEVTMFDKRNSAHNANSQPVMN